MVGLSPSQCGGVVRWKSWSYNYLSLGSLVASHEPTVDDAEAGT